MLNDAQLSAMCRDFAVLLKAGIPLHEGVRGMTGETEQDPVFTHAIDLVAETLSQNKRLHEALATAGCFPAYLVQMVRIGETSGRLDSTLDALAAQYAQNDSMKQRLKSAILYPVILIAMMTAVIIVLIWAVLPVFASVLSQFDSDAAASADAVMGVSTGLCIALLVLMGLILLSLICVLIMSKTKKGAEALSRFFNNSIFTRRAAKSISTGNFVLSMATMLKSGIPITEAVDLAMPAVRNDGVRQRAEGIKADIESGVPQEKAFENSMLFSAVDCRLITVACRSGVLDSAMEQLSEQYSRKNAETLERAVSAVEPALIAMLAVIIGAIMLSAMLPLIRIMSAIG